MDQLRVVWERTGVKPKELDELVELPFSCYTAWEAFAKMNARRTSNGFGINPITYSEIDSYCSLYQLVLEPWELDLICAFDNEALISHSKQAQQAQKQNSAKSKRK